MSTVTIPTTPETREAFAKLGLTLWNERPGIEERWDFNEAPAVWLMKDHEPNFYHPTCKPMLSAQVLQILGLLQPPPGMVMVPWAELALLVELLKAKQEQEERDGAVWAHRNEHLKTEYCAGVAFGCLLARTWVEVLIPKEPPTTPEGEG